MIVLEGVDGSGKSTIAKLLSKSLGMEVIHFPSPDVKQANKHLYSEVEMSKEQLFLLFLSDILSHKDQLKGKIIDRYVYSTIAYQHGIFNLELLAQILSTLGFPKPELVAYIDIPVETAIERISSSRSKKSVFENKESLSVIKKEYDKMCFEGFYGKWLKLDATLSPQELAGIIAAEYNKIKLF